MNEAKAKAIEAATLRALETAAGDPITPSAMRLLISEAIDAYEAALWQPVKDMPDKGTFLIFCDGLIVKGDRAWLIYYDKATHFHPLPKPPQ